MESLINKLKASEQIKIINYYSIIIFLFLYVFSVPSFGSRTGLNYIVYAVMAILGLLVFFYSFLYKKPRYNKSSLVIPFFALFSIVGTLFYSHQYRTFFTIVLLTLSFFVLYYAFIAIGNKMLVLVVVISALFAFTCYFIYVYRTQLLDFASYVNGNIRLGTYFDGQNAVSAFAIISFILSFYALLFIKYKYRWFFILSILSSFIVGVSTGSRTFVVAFIIITLVILFFKLKKHPLIYLLIVGFFCTLVIILFTLPFMTTLRDRFIRIIWTFFTDSSRVDTSALERTIWLDYGFYLGNKHLLFGTGPYGFGVMSGLYTYTHSNFSEVWCDFGLIGFILFCSPLVMCVVKSFMDHNSNKAIITSVFVYYMLVSFSNVFYYFKFYYLILAFCYYLVFYEKDDKSYVHIDNLLDKYRSIVITCEGLDPGGAERVITELSNDLASKGYNVSVIGVSTHNIDSFYLLDNGVKYITLHKGQDERIKSFKRVRLLRKTIKSIKPDVIISFLPHINVYTYYATIGMRTPVIDAERNNPKMDPKGFVLRRLKKTAFYQADGAVFQTEESKYYYRKEVRDKSVVINNPVNSKLLDIKASDNKNKVVLSVGRLTEQKNHKLLIDAFSIFSIDHPDYILRIYGEGHLHDELIEYAKNKGIDNKFELLPPDSNWQEKEKDDAMFVLASDYEGMPNALLEAMCIGMPCISTDSPSGGPYELIKDGENGFLTKVGDAQMLADKMGKILITKFEFDLEEYRNRLSIDKISNEWLDYMKLVLERKLSA